MQAILAMLSKPDGVKSLPLTRKEQMQVEEFLLKDQERQRSWEKDMVGGWLSAKGWQNVQFYQCKKWNFLSSASYCIQFAFNKCVLSIAPGPSTEACIHCCISLVHGPLVAFPSSQGAKFRLQQDALNALPSHLRALAMQPDLSHPPPNRKVCATCDCLR